MPDALKYRAFLSYSRRDTKIAKRVLKALDRFKVHKSLVGSDGELGPVPRRVAPIFFDRDEMAPGEGLSDQTIAALDASATLVVLCSPSAAASAYVNREIAQFRERHPDRRVIPLIVAGPAGTEAKAFFPPALVDQAEDRLAADLRRQAEGYRRALSKVIARILGVPSDAGIRRTAQTLQRESEVWFGAIALVVVLAGALASMAWAVVEHNMAQKAACAMDEKGGRGEISPEAPIEIVPSPRQSWLTWLVPQRGCAGPLGSDDNLHQLVTFDDLKDMGRLRTAATRMERQIRTEISDTITAWIRISRAAGRSEPDKAREAYIHALRLDPTKAETWGLIVELNRAVERPDSAK